MALRSSQCSPGGRAPVDGLLGHRRPLDSSSGNGLRRTRPSGPPQRGHRPPLPCGQRSPAGQGLGLDPLLLLRLGPAGRGHGDPGLCQQLSSGLCRPRLGASHREGILDGHSSSRRCHGLQLPRHPPGPPPEQRGHLVEASHSLCHDLSPPASLLSSGKPLGDPLRNDRRRS